MLHVYSGRDFCIDVSIAYAEQKCCCRVVAGCCWSMWGNYYSIYFCFCSYPIFVCLQCLLVTGHCWKWTFHLPWNRCSIAHMGILCKFLHQDHLSASFWRYTGVFFIFSVPTSSLRWLLPWLPFQIFPGKNLLRKSVWWTSCLVINFDCFSTALGLQSQKCSGNNRSVFTIPDYAINSWWHSGNSSMSNFQI